MGTTFQHQVQEKIFVFFVFTPSLIFATSPKIKILNLSFFNPQRQKKSNMRSYLDQSHSVSRNQFFKLHNRHLCSPPCYSKCRPRFKCKFYQNHVFIHSNRYLDDHQSKKVEKQ